MFSDSVAENRLLAAFIDSPSDMRVVKEEIFTEERARLFNAMKSAYIKHGFVSTEAVELEYGKPVPAEIEIARGAKAKPIIEKLTRLAYKRELLRVTDQINTALAKDEIDKESINRILKVNAVVKSEDSGVHAGVDSFVTDLSMKINGTYRFIDTGLPFLNMMMGGEWPRQALSVIMGQAGGGKTALVCQSVVNMARLGFPSLFVSLEMPKAKLIARFVANMASVNGLKLRSGKISKEEMDRVDEALAEVQSLPIYIIDNPDMTASDIVEEVKLHKDLYGIQAFFVDYLQIVNNSSGSDSMFEELGYVAQQFRNAAKIEDIAAIALVQQNRQFRGLHSIQGSSKIGQIADTAIEIMMDSQSPNDSRRACSLDFHKNRDGPLGQQPCNYIPSFLRFE